MLTGPRRSIFAAQRGNRLFGAQRRAAARGGDRRRSARRVGRRRRPASSGLVRRRSRGASGIDVAVAARAASTSTTTSSSVACTASRHDAARCARSLSAVARAMSSSATTARIDSSVDAGVLDRGLVLVGLDAKRRHDLVGGAHVLLQPLRARARRRRAAPRPPRPPRARSSICARDLIELAGQRARAQLELGGRFLQPPHVGLERRRRARRARHARRRLRRRGGSGPRPLRAPPNERRCAAVSRSSATRWSCSSRPIDARASSCRRSSASRSSSA